MYLYIHICYAYTLAANKNAYKIHRKFTKMHLSTAKLCPESPNKR